MNIVYVSHLSGASYAGPTYSVPRQIAAQAKYDNVFWYNAVKIVNEEWKRLSYYHDLYEYPSESISMLPEPYNNPDLVIVEQFYNMTRSRIRNELIKRDIPYIIIPRGELTKQAQARKRVKKRIANLLFCMRFARKAAAIQYLTMQEYADSGNRWNKNHVIIPNGIDIPSQKKVGSISDGIKCISIGRIEPYQKGLDLLIDACASIRDLLARTQCTITICGPDKENKKEQLREAINEAGLSQLVFLREGVYGKEKEELLLQSDVYLMTSRFEGHPMALIEAMSYGIPCVVTTGSNMRNEVELYDAGWVADVNAMSIATALSNMIAEKSLISSKAENAARLSKEYDWDNIAKISSQQFRETIF